MLFISKHSRRNFKQYVYHIPIQEQVITVLHKTSGVFQHINYNNSYFQMLTKEVLFYKKEVVQPFNDTNSCFSPAPQFVHAYAKTGLSHQSLFFHESPQQPSQS